jgi:PKD repeat protein
LKNSSVTFSAAGSTFPSGDDVTFTWDFGDGSGASGSAPTHTYAQAGSFTATLTVTDPYGANSSATTQITVQSTLDGIAVLNRDVDELATTGALNRGQVKLLHATLDAADRQCRRDNGRACAIILGAFILELRVTEGATPVIAYARRVIASIF